MSTATAKAPKKAPPQQDVEPEFVLPELSLMTFVEVTTTLDWSEFAGGIVIKVNNRTVDVLMIVGGYGGGLCPLPDCIHADDPWIHERPDMFKDGDRGIFRLAKSEKMSRLVLNCFTQSNVMIEQLLARVAQLEKKAGITPPKPARGNGKPPTE